MYVVYQHKNKINGKLYIGITKQDPHLRWGSGGRNYKDCRYFYAAIKKYGWDNFEHIVLYENLTHEAACKIERDLISGYKTQDRKFGYNIAEGGNAPRLTQETKDLLSRALMGNKNGLGHPCSAEKAKRISEAQKGRHLTSQHKEKLSASAKLRHVPCSEAKRTALRDSYPKMRKVYCRETDTVYKSVQACARALNLPATNISKLCRGRGKTIKGYHIEYYNTTNA